MTAQGGVELAVEGSSKNEKGLMDMHNRVVIVGDGGIRKINGSGKIQSINKMGLLKKSTGLLELSWSSNFQ